MVWTRWVSKAEKYEIFRESTIILIYNIAKNLYYLNVKNIIYLTSCPHHHDTFCIYTASNILHLSNIFLNTIIFNGDSIPIIDKGDYSTNKPYGKKLNNRKLDKSIDKFILNLKNKKPPEINPSTSNLIRKNYLIANLVLILVFTKCVYFKNLYYFIFKRKKLNKYFSDYNLLERLKLLYYQRNYLYSYRKNSVNINVKKRENPFLIIYAHHQPEASTMPMGGKYTSHIDLIIELRLKGYQEKIFYKEHPSIFSYLIGDNNKIEDIDRVGLHRSKKYLENLLKLNCQLLPTNFQVDQNKITTEMFVPITITGNIALERSLLGLSTIVFGNPWWKEMPGIIHIDSIKTLEVINKQWTIPSSSIIEESKIWLDKTLSNKTIKNSIGVGYKKELISSKDIELTNKDIFNLIEELNNE